MFEVKEFPEFSWSFSRHKTLMDCARKYGLQYYESHNGWLYDSDEKAKQAYRLKKLTNMPILFGQIFHEIVDDTIKELIKTGYVPTKEELMEKARRMLNRAFIDSRDYKSFWFNQPSRYKMIFEMYYDGKIEQDVINEYRHRLEKVFENLFYSKSFQDIINRQHTMRFHQAEEFRYIPINGTKVYVVMDLLYRDIKEGKWIIVDWKTGKASDDDRTQLAVYAYYIMKIFNIPLSDIEIRNEYVLDGSHESYEITEKNINMMLEKMEQSIQLMKRYQLDILRNEPVAIEEFEKTQYANKCVRCNYKEMCKVEL